MTDFPVSTPAPRDHLLSFRIIGGVVAVLVILVGVLLIPSFWKAGFIAEHNQTPFYSGTTLNLRREQDKTISIHNIAAIPSDTKTALQRHNWLRIGLDTRPLWIDFELRMRPDTVSANEPIYLEFGMPLINHIEMLVFDAEGNLVTSALNGDEISQDQRALPFPPPTFKLHLKPEVGYHVYFRLQSDSFMATSLSILTADELIEKTLWQRFYTSLYYGMMTAMLFFNLFTYFFFRHKSYIFYVGHIIFSCLLQATLDGFLAEKTVFPWLITIRWPVIYSGFANLCAIGFTRHFLELPNRNSLENRLLDICSMGAAITIALEPFLHNIAMSYFTMFGVITSCVLVPVVGLKRYLDGFQFASFFLLAWILYPCLLVLYCLVMGGVLDPDPLSFNATRIGCMLECGLFSMALGFRMEVLRRDKHEIVRQINRQLQREIKSISLGIESLANGKLNHKLVLQPKGHLSAIAEDYDLLAKTLRRSEEERQQWLSDISHELKTPITVFRATIESFQDGVIPVNDKSLAILHKEALRLEHLVKDLNELNLCEQQHRQDEISAVNLVELIEHELGFFHNLFQEKRIMYRLITQEREITLEGNEKRLSQLIINLLNNTLKYTDSPGRLVISLMQDDDAINLCWEDSSPGVSEEHLPLLFDRLYRVDKSRARSNGGSGLGLAICKAIVESHGGKISARRSAMNGLSIDMSLPRQNFRRHSVNDA